MKNTTDLDSDKFNLSLEEEQHKLQKFKVWVSVAKWVVSNLVIGFIVFIVDQGFRERSAGIQEMQAFDRYVEIILRADNIEERWKLSEFFSTVTPTERLREKWITYKQLIHPEYIAFKTLIKEKDSLTALVKSSEVTEKLKKVNKKLESYEKKLVTPEQPGGGSLDGGSFDKSLDISFRSDKDQGTSVSTLEDFLKELKQKSKNDFRYRLNEYFQKTNEINNSVVNKLIAQLGDPFVNIQTGYHNDFKAGYFSNQYGIVSKFDNDKKIWPVLRAQFTMDSIVLTLKEENQREIYKASNRGGIEWNDIRSFIEQYYLKRLDKLK